jgi:hypothetical protein
LPAALTAGVQALQVVHQQLLGTPPVPHAGVESNVLAFVLHPTLTIVLENVESRTVNGTTLRSADAVLTLDPPVRKRQRVVLLLNELNPPAGRAARGYSFHAPSRDLPSLPDSTATITVPIIDIIPGDYLVRVQVDGAESPLDVDVSGAFNGPRVTI